MLRAIFASEQGHHELHYVDMDGRWQAKGDNQLHNLDMKGRWQAKGDNQLHDVNKDTCNDQDELVVSGHETQF